MNAGLSVRLPQPLPHNLPCQPRVLLTDVDDTLTWQGRVPLEAMQALYALADANIAVVPVTGASAGWCDCLMKTWPIPAIVGENGAFFLYRTTDDTVQRQWLKPESAVKRDRQRLENLGKELRARYPAIHHTQDHAFRLTEVAFDIGQVARVSRETSQEATAWLRAKGISARQSSIHINAWIGDHSKATGALAWLARQGLTEDDSLFIGDSPNDEPMFERFPHTVGVANIRDFLPLMAAHPKYITQAKGGHGFAELARRILEL
ncbi:HAD-IIB family hydrolase [Marinobacter sp. NFXS9]|uniref:HAD-IIB family hydrolase n=1 Tax=Marinobacter sp. NFXS9 TaxID=2818433 RepID=UPI0032E0012D